jgi:regulator of chromosome condensation
MHTVALSNHGKVYTWGCNDEGALGREGPENTPMLVADSLQIPVTDVSAGDSHTIAYNTELNQVYIWGLYRVSENKLLKDLINHGAFRMPCRENSTMACACQRE